MKPTRELLVELSTWREPAGGVLSVYARTDPRDPANTARTPAWLVALRNGLAAVGRRIDEAGTRAERLAFRALSERVEAELPALEPAARARGVAWFLSADGALDRRVSLQLAPRAGAVRWDERPVVSPLVDVVDRGRATGLVLVAGERVRLLHWEGGRVSEPERSVFELELGDWREYAAYARANPARAQQTATHQAAFEQRVEDWRRRFLRDAAAATSDRLASCSSPPRVSSLPASPRRCLPLCGRTWSPRSRRTCSGRTLQGSRIDSRSTSSAPGATR